MFNKRQFDEINERLRRIEQALIDHGVLKYGAIKHDWSNGFMPIIERELEIVPRNKSAESMVNALIYALNMELYFEESKPGRLVAKKRSRSKK